MRTVGQRSISDVEIDDLLLLGYPEENDLFLSRFRLVIVEGEITRQTHKRLYWQRDKNGRLKIITEDSG